MSDSQFNIHGEIWKPIPEYPGYDISDQGRVRSYWRRKRLGKNQGTMCILDDSPQRTLKPSFHLGYPYITLTRDGAHYKKHIHVLVLETFIGPRPLGNHSRHLNGIRAESCLSNLSWGTPIENGEDTKRHGNSLIGVKNHSAKLTDDEIHQIRELAHNGLPQRKIAKLFKICQSNVWYIIHRLHWKHIPQ